MRYLRRRRLHLAGVALTALILGACGDDDQPTHNAGGSALEVVASFYPLQFVVEQVGGGRASVTNMTPVGAEPHDLELTPKDAAALQDADLVVYLAGFTPTVDDAVDSVDNVHAFDVASAARLGPADPHFWLDPTRLADVADAVAARLGELDPDHAAEFDANAATLRTALETLDAEFESGLATCASRSIVTSHEAFGYLAQRYDLTQVGIAGLSTAEEPSPASIAAVAEYVRENDVSTIYFETLIDPAIAETVASETGAVTAVLDPMEGLSDESAGDDYLEVMRANLQTLRRGQDCT